jgi:serine/threonine protein phosphatase PrpC
MRLFEKWAKLLQGVLMLMVDIGDAIRRSDLFLAVCDGMGAKVV